MTEEFIDHKVSSSPSPDERCITDPDICFWYVRTVMYGDDIIHEGGLCIGYGGCDDYLPQHLLYKEKGEHK